MKLHSIDLPYGKKKHLHSTSQIVSLGGLAFTFLTIVTLYSASFFMRSSLQSLPSSSDEVLQGLESVGVNENCDLFTGEWVPNPSAPYYTNETCSAIYEHQNCMKYGRPDLEFMKWRWKPDDCELPIFDPVKFLELVRGKSLAFVGDSVARNHMQSLICLLSRVVSPVDVTNSTDQQSKQYDYPHHNFTVANFWSPFLVKSSEPDQTINSKLFTLYLDEFDESWTTKIEEFDYVIISGGHWFFRPSTLYDESQPIGCHYCSLSNVTELAGHRKAFRTAFRAINSLKNYKGVTFLRTFAPSHFENGLWDEGGDCARRRPFMRNETYLDGTHLELYMAQIEEFKVAQEEAVKRGLKFRLLDTTQAMLRRPDGHPSKYGRAANLDWPNDCVHWCLPGPIDTFNDLLLEMMRRESIHSKGGPL